MPAVQTDAQMEAFAKKLVESQEQSEAATPQVLAFFDSSEFRVAMNDCCPKVAEMSSQEILDWYNSEAMISELAHAMPAEATGSHFTDGNLDTMMTYGWFLNEWQGEIIGGDTDKSKSLQNGASELLFGLPHSPDVGFTWDEAADRMIYVAQNFYQSDFGSSANFGDMTAIFSSSYVKDMVMIAPMDTGRWSMSGCNPSLQVSGRPHHNENCSTWNPQVVGTLEHHNHMILPNFDHNAVQAQGGRVAKAKQFFARCSLAGPYEDLPALTSNDYWESNIVGHPRLADGVKFVIGNFPVLFGTDVGRKLQQVADHYSWPVVWSYGQIKVHLESDADASVPGNKRFLDPLGEHTNASFSNNALSSFEQVWSDVEKSRSSGTPASSQFDQWWSTLAQSQIRLAPMTARSCDDFECIGTVISSHECICKPTTEIAV